MGNKKAKKQEKKAKKLIAYYLRQGWNDYVSFEGELKFLDAQYINGRIEKAEVAQKLKKYDTFKKILALVLLDEDNCKYVPLNVLQRTCFLDLLSEINYDTFRYAMMRVAYQRHLNDLSVRLVEQAGYELPFPTESR